MTRCEGGIFCCLYRQVIYVNVCGFQHDYVCVVAKHKVRRNMRSYQDKIEVHEGEIGGPYSHTPIRLGCDSGEEGIRSIQVTSEVKDVEVWHGDLKCAGPWAGISPPTLPPSIPAEYRRVLVNSKRQHGLGSLQNRYFASHIHLVVFRGQRPCGPPMLV